MITVLFSCDTCGLKDVECLVRARQEQEGVVEWMQKVVLRCIADRHRSLRLFCDAKSLQNLKIPLDDDDESAWIGKQTDNKPPRD